MTLIEEPEPTFRTDPSSSAMRARPSVWVFTTSSQSTAVLVEALMFFCPRAMLTAGIMRETSPARWPAACGSAAAGKHSRNDIRNADPQAHGDFVFIADLLREFFFLPTLVTGAARHCQFEFPPGFRVCQPGCAARRTSPRAQVAILRKTGPKGSCESASDWPRIRTMKALAVLLVAAAIFGGIYFFYLKKMPSTDQGTAPTQAISLTGVRMDLNQIAQAERAYIVSNGRCAGLDELVSSGSMNLARS